MALELGRSAATLCTTNPTARILALVDTAEILHRLQRFVLEVCPTFQLLRGSPCGNHDASGGGSGHAGGNGTIGTLFSVLVPTAVVLASYWDRVANFSKFVQQAGLGGLAKLDAVPFLPRCIDEVLFVDTDVFFAKELSGWWAMTFARARRSFLFIQANRPVGLRQTVPLQSRRRAATAVITRASWP